MVRPRLVGVGVVVAVTCAAALYLARRRRKALGKGGRNQPRGILVRSRKHSRGAVMRAKWDEETLREHDKERGKAYGTMKIDHPDTPYLYYDFDQQNEVVKEYVRGEEPKEINITELQERLGVLHLAQGKGEEVATPAQQGSGDGLSFAEKRKAHYHNEAAACTQGKAQAPADE